ncbi:hypothetical protein [Actinoplanes sp. NPDC051859]|uniref:hypothetical protein n=1 Tax=Actinoplanes sp. NPDC051859 TaxID=3363909 RepID=UPI0037890155
MQWPCDEAKLERIRAAAAALDRTGAWPNYSAAAQIGHAGYLSRLGEHRALGGRK